MRQLYASSWQQIKFPAKSNFKKRIPSKQFYTYFYNELFKKYNNYQELNHNWLKQKNKIFKWIIKNIKNKKQVLSVGCGIGYIENNLLKNKSKKIYLSVFEPSSNALKWLIESENQFIIHTKMPMQKNIYDYILLIALDYALDNLQFSTLLKKCFYNLKKNGTVILVSESIESTNLKQQIFAQFQKLIYNILWQFGLMKRTYLWGWQRKKHEIQRIFSMSPFKKITSGYIIDTFPKNVYFKGTKL